MGNLRVVLGSHRQVILGLLYRQLPEGVFSVTTAWSGLFQQIVLDPGFVLEEEEE